MKSTQKRIISILIIISIAYFILFIFPNDTGGKDQIMLSLFAADEATQLQVVTKMLAAYPTLGKTLLAFVAYRHYYYGSSFYFPSALVVLPIKLVTGGKNVQLNILALRQLINVLPMLASLLLLTHLQTKFTSCAKSILLFVFLLSVAAVTHNNLWWHVDSVTFLFVVLTFYFLDRDNLRFGRNFYFAAIATGLAAGTKLIGFFFFLAIPVYLLWGLRHKNLKLPTAVNRGLSFVGIMFATIFISNPFMIFPSQFSRMVRILSTQFRAMSGGWVIVREANPLSWLPVIESFYGKLIFVLISLLVLGLGIWRGKNKILHLMIAAWAIPFGTYMLFTVAIRPPQYFLPILLPVFSSMIVLAEFPPFAADRPRRPVAWILGVVVLAVISYQFIANLTKDVAMYRAVMTRENTQSSIIFYKTLEREYLPRIKTNDRLVVYLDIKMYFPDNRGWAIRSYWTGRYSTLEKIKHDIVILWPQRVLDYSQDNIQASANDPAAFQDIYEFAMDARHGKLRGYHLIYQDSNGMFFVSDELYQQYFNN